MTNQTIKRKNMVVKYTWIEAGIFDSVLDAKQYRDEHYTHCSYETQRYSGKRVKLFVKKQEKLTT